MKYWMKSLASAATLTCLACVSPAFAGSAQEALVQNNGNQMLKEMLTRGAESAVDILGQKNGFLNNAKARIPLPDSLQAAEQAMNLLGKNKQGDQLVTTMNHAAEQAMAEAGPILVEAISNMSVQDANSILTGGEGSATRYFRSKTSDTLASRLLPSVQQATSRLDMAQQYNEYASLAAGTGLINQKDANINDYIASKAVDGLFTVMEEQERAIRKDPVAAGSKLLESVLGGGRFKLSR